jgi:hypothetical protein
MPAFKQPQNRRATKVYLQTCLVNPLTPRYASSLEDEGTRFENNLDPNIRREQRRRMLECDLRQ